MQGHLEQTVLDLCAGQQMDISFRDIPPTPQQYTEMVLRKTGILLGAACKMGAMAAEQPDAVWARAALFGEALGVAFQYQDDYLGVWGDAKELGKEPDDLAQRRCGIPLVLAAVEDPQVRSWMGYPREDARATELLERRLDALGIKKLARTARGPRPGLLLQGIVAVRPPAPLRGEHREAVLGSL
ncbi:MAG: polyprenyl synthetase family protein [Chloroflexota bacterium]|nr:polyprenyl synthetase family protein [Chloroflexota bacterium]